MDDSLESRVSSEDMPSDPIERRRMIYRINQRRHRERLRVYKAELESAVKRLTGEICEKSALIQELRLTTGDAVLRAGRARMHCIRDYARLFHRGFVFRDAEMLAQQEEFLTRHFHPAMWLNDEKGRQEYREQLILLSRLHASMDNQVESIRLHGTNDIVRVNSTLNLQLSSESFLYIYPRLRSESEYNGATLSVPLTSVYYFQGAEIHRVFLFANFLPAWTALTEDSKQALSIVLNANLTFRYGTIKHQIRILDYLDRNDAAL